MLTLVLGGAASGKSSVAERLVAERGPDVVYVATGVATDPDMAARIAVHQRRRPSQWQTVETDDLVATVAALPPRPALIDSLGTWVAHTYFEVDAARFVSGDFAVDVGALCTVLAARTAPTVVVSDEVGLGVHPQTEVGRRFRDAMGHLNRHVSDVATDILLVVAGRTLRIS